MKLHQNSVHCNQIIFCPTASRVSGLLELTKQQESKLIEDDLVVLLGSILLTPVRKLFKRWEETVITEIKDQSIAIDCLD